MGTAWNPGHYDSKLGFVSEYGKDVVLLLRPSSGERILDLGCGTGDLTHEISKSGASVVGMDLSESMIVEARKKYPNLQFTVDNGEIFRTDEPFDAVFSNAALHWMKRPSKVVESVWLALKPGGRLVAEFGGKGVANTVIIALENALGEFGIPAREKNPWYFPTIGEYATLLENHGLRTTYAAHFDRPTPMADGERGLEHWLNGFAGSYLQALDLGTRSSVIRRVEQMTRSRLFQDGQWVVDYKRLRIVAVKE